MKRLRHQAFVEDEGEVGRERLLGAFVPVL